MSNFRPAAEAAARWWAEQVGQPVFDNGDPSGIAGMLATVAASGTAVPTTDVAQVFVDRLARKIEDLLAIQQREHPRVSLGVDYGPDLVLTHAAQAAGISTQRFPWKTNQWVYEHYVVASVGYGGRSRVIWRDEAPLPTCGILRVPGWDGHEDHYPAERSGLVREPWGCGRDVHHEGPHEFTVPVPLCSVCNRTEDDWQHQDAYAATVHPFSPGAVTVCSICWEDPRRAKEDCQIWDAKAGRWVKTGHPHQFEDMASTALSQEEADQPKG